MYERKSPYPLRRYKINMNLYAIEQGNIVVDLVFEIEAENISEK